MRQDWKLKEQDKTRKRTQDKIEYGRKEKEKYEYITV